MQVFPLRQTENDGCQNRKMRFRTSTRLPLLLLPTIRFPGQARVDAAEHAGCGRHVEMGPRLRDGRQNRGGPGCLQYGEVFIDKF